MKPGIRLLKRLFITLFLTLFLGGICNVQAEKVIEERDQEMQDAQTRKDVLKKKAYYHFFLEEYLTAATDLKLLEAAAKTKDDIVTLNESRRLLGSLYLAWGMDRSATRIFKGLIESASEGREKIGLFKIVQKMQYDRTLHQAAIETYGLFAAEKESPGMDQAVYLAGMSYYSTGFIQEGIDLLSSITPDSRYFPYAQLTLAKSYYRLNNLSESLHIFENNSRFNPKGGPLLQSLAEKIRLTWGQVLIEEERTREAALVLQRIPKLSPFYSEALFSRGWAAFKNKNLHLALPLFQSLIQNDPAHPYALESLTLVGHAHRQMEDNETALEQYADAIDIYAKEEKKLLDFQARIEDPGQLTLLLETKEEDRDLLKGQEENENRDLYKFMKGDDVLRFWIGQYRSLFRLSDYLDQKLRDMDVFQVMVDHREAIFRQALPKLDRSLAKHSLPQLQKRERELSTRVEGAIREENLIMFATPDEGNSMGQLTVARERSHALGARIVALEDLETSPTEGSRLVVLKKEWRKLHRILKVAEGEWTWKIATTLPGRTDDLMRRLRRLHADLLQVEDRFSTLTRSVPTLDLEIAMFRFRIEAAQTRLAAQRKKTRRMKERLLPALQTLLLKQLAQKRGRLHAWMDAAELSQIQILDAAGMKPEMN
ncbi:MAG: tetratricopeptide repeat protein [Nitrospiria bacterium]